jgi:hypothetical protein
MYKKFKEQFPEIVTYQADLEKQIRKNIKALELNKYMRTTSDEDTTWFDIPVVFHIMHDYGREFVPDNNVYTILKKMNDDYSVKNDTTGVIAPFKKYVGKAYIRFHLATKDPLGKPTKGITRRYTYETYGGDEFDKMDQWNPASYLNIWLENHIGTLVPGGEVLAYATLPPGAAADPYSDGIIGRYDANNIVATTYSHEAGHIFYLYHPWDHSGEGAGVACGDDEVDDTPPTKGHTNCSNLYDTACATNYFKIYASSVAGVDSLVDYPDTTNVQNIMDYSSTCTNMFTKGQVTRMRATLRSYTANRDSLWTPFNLSITGALAPMPDLPPKADFSIQNGISYTPTAGTRYFQCVGKTFYFKNQSWGDTVSDIAWEFPNGTPSTSTNMTSAISVSFNAPGWANVSLVANSNAGSDTITKALVYVADPIAIQPKGYFEEFNTSAGNDLDKWPMFNFYNNAFKWQLANVGYYDNSCIMYTGWDNRSYPAILTGSPRGDFDDFFSPAFDLTPFAVGNCNINFMYAGAFRTGISLNMNDTLDISYSTDCGNTWNLLNNHHLTKTEISTIGSLGIPFAPVGEGDWKLQSIDIPVAARTNSVFFRFRYKPGTDKYGNSTGNNFYIDRININNEPLGVNTPLPHNGIVVIPNPTNSNAYVIIKDNGTGKAKITVSDITGKQVYITEQELTGGVTQIEIPSKYISVKGIYMVQIIAGDMMQNEKLIVY